MIFTFVLSYITENTSSSFKSQELVIDHSVSKKVTSVKITDINNYWNKARLIFINKSLGWPTNLQWKICTERSTGHCRIQSYWPTSNSAICTENYVLLKRHPIGFRKDLVDSTSNINANGQDGTDNISLGSICIVNIVAVGSSRPIDWRRAQDRQNIIIFGRIEGNICTKCEWVTVHRMKVCNSNLIWYCSCK